jgi:hypothetical protein
LLLPKTQAIRQVRFANERATQRDEIGIACGQHLFHRLLRTQTTDQHDRQPRHGPCLPGKRAEVGFIYPGENPWTSVQVSTISADPPADLQRVQAHLVQGCYDLNRFLRRQATFHAIHHAELDEYRVVWANLLTHGLADSSQEAHTPLQVTTPIVSTPVDEGREELADQVTVSGMDLNGVKTCLLSPARCLGVGLDQQMDLLKAYLVCRLIQEGSIYR